MTREVVVTGLGVVTPIGRSVPDFWDSLKAGDLKLVDILAINTLPGSNVR